MLAFDVYFFFFIIRISKAYYSPFLATGREIHQ